MLLQRLLASTFLRAPETEGGAAPVAVEGAADAGAAAADAGGASAPAAESAAAPASEAAAAAESGAPAASLISQASKDKGADAPAESKAEGEGDKPAADAPAEKAEPAKDAPAPAEAAGEKKPDGEADPAAKDATAEKPPAATYETFSVPEGISLDTEVVSKFTGILDNAELNPQQRAQELVNLYVAEAQQMVERLQEHQHEVFANTRRDWVQEFVKDKDLGGNRAETTLSVCAAVIDEFGGTDEQKAALRQQLDYTGAGDNVAVIRLLHNIGQKLNVIESGYVPGTPPNPNKGKERHERWYGGT